MYIVDKEVKMYNYSQFPQKVDLQDEAYKQNITIDDKKNIDLGKEYYVGADKIITALFINKLMDGLRAVQQYSLGLNTEINTLKSSIGSIGTNTLTGTIKIMGMAAEEDLTGTAEVIE